MATALVISKDLVIELKRLAVIADKDGEALENARAKFETADERHNTSASKFASSLYDFTHRYANQPELIDAKLHELGAQFKSTTSVYQRIARIAFDDVRDTNGEVKRVQVLGYGKLMEMAHAAGTSPADFKKLVSPGISAAKKKLGLSPPARPKAIALGRAEASKYFSNKTFPLTGFMPSLHIEDGEEVELIAKFESGQLVVYGIIPPGIGSTSDALSKLGTTLIPPAKHVLDLLPELVRALKLVTNGKDKNLLATYEVSSKEVQFAVVGSGAIAVLSAPLELDFLSGRSISLPVVTWNNICSTLMPISKQVQSVTWDKDTLVATVDEGQIPNVARWFEDKGKARTVGDAVDASIRIEVENSNSGTSLVAGTAWRDSTSFDEAALKPLTEFKPTKTIIAFKLGAGGLIVKEAKETVADHVNLKRKQHALFKAVCSKLFRLASAAAPVVTLDKADGYLRASALTKGGLRYAVIFEVE